MVEHTEQTKNEAIDQKEGFDSLLSAVGDLGLFQKRFIVLLCLPGISCALHKLAWVFVGAQVDHRCMLPGESAESATFVPNLMNSSGTWKNDGKCKIMNDTSIECDRFIYDTSIFSGSAVIEFGLVCSSVWARSLIDSGMMFGDTSGSIIFGNLSDRLGRRSIFFSSVVLQACAGILASLAPDYWTFLLARTVVGFTISGVYITCYVIGMEMIDASKRQYAAITLQVAFSIGFMLSAVFAWFIQEWRHLQLALSLPGLLCLAAWWYIPESARWLLGQGRVDEASTLLQHIAKVNNKKIEASIFEKQVAAVSSHLQVRSNQESLLRIFKFPALLRSSLIIFFAWFTNNVSYFGLSFSTGSLAGNPYVNFILSGAVEIPAYIIILLAFHLNFRRKTVFCASYVIAGAALLLSTLVGSDMPYLLNTLAMVGKMAITSACGVTYVVSAEIFPTCVRNAGLGAASMSAGIGAVISPFLVLLSDWWRNLPFLIWGSLALTAAGLVMLLPETLGTKLPETLADGDIASAARKKSKIITIKL